MEAACYVTRRREMNGRKKKINKQTEENNLKREKRAGSSSEQGSISTNKHFVTYTTLRKLYTIDLLEAEQDQIIMATSSPISEKSSPKGVEF